MKLLEIYPRNYLRVFRYYSSIQTSDLLGTTSGVSVRRGFTSDLIGSTSDLLGHYYGNLRNPIDSRGNLRALGVLRGATSVADVGTAPNTPRHSKALQSTPKHF